MYKVDIVMQGPMWSKTYTTAESYFTLPWVNRVFISTWEGQNCPDTNYRIIPIKSPDLINPGDNNRNRQLFSSRVGVDRCTADLIMKTRTDQQIDIPSMRNMYNYFMEHYQIDRKFLDGSGPKGAIFTVGLYSGFPFHPEDHLFFGFREDIQKLFDLPLDPKVPPNPLDPTNRSGESYTREDARPNAYLGMHYYARFSKEIRNMVNNYREYVVDLAPKKSEAFAAEFPFKDVIFKAFPRISLWWEKYNQSYPYEVGIGYSEYWGESW